MKFTIHPSAAENYNKKANELLNLVEECPIEPPKSVAFKSDMFIAGTITEKDIIGSAEFASSDYKGNTVARYFEYQGKRFGIKEENYKRLIEVSDRIQTQPSIRSKLSKQFIEKNLFTWIYFKFIRNETFEFFIDYLESQASNVVKKMISWIPIANLEIQTPFPVSKSTIRPITEAVFNTWEKKIRAGFADDDEHILKYIQKIRIKFQGLAAVVTEIEAEPEYAFDYAIGEAKNITSALSIFSGATLIPDVKNVSVIKGTESTEHATAFIVDAEDKIQSPNKILDITSSKIWRLKDQDISDIRKSGLDSISNLLSAENLTDFEKSVLNSILLYAKSATTNDPVEKVIYITSALENILLKNENEPIQQNLAERIAVFTSNELSERKSIIKTIKTVYAIRSKFLHHGHSSSEFETMKEFMMKTWVFYIQLLENIEKFKTKEEFINTVDDHKLS